MCLLAFASAVFYMSTFDFNAAVTRLKKVVTRTPLQLNTNLSRKYNANVYLKREDLQVVRSYKLRGAYNLMSSLEPDQLRNGVVCASSGNHAQGFAYSCKQLRVKGVVFMPIVTPNQKVSQTKMFGEEWVHVILIGDTFDDCAASARQYTAEHNMKFIPPFDDLKIIEGQGTVAVEILEDLPNIDFLFAPIGGGGLVAGIGSYFKTSSPQTIIVGVEPEGAPSMHEALKAGHPVTLDSIDRFVDGAAVKRVGDITFNICKPGSRRPGALCLKARPVLPFSNSTTKTPSLLNPPAHSPLPPSMNTLTK